VGQLNAERLAAAKSPKRKHGADKQDGCAVRQMAGDTAPDAVGKMPDTLANAPDEWQEQQRNDEEGGESRAASPDPLVAALAEPDPLVAPIEAAEAASQTEEAAAGGKDASVMVTLSDDPPAAKETPQPSPAAAAAAAAGHDAVSDEEAPPSAQTAALAAPPRQQHPQPLTPSSASLRLAAYAHPYHSISRPQPPLLEFTGSSMMITQQQTIASSTWPTPVSIVQAPAGTAVASGITGGAPAAVPHHRWAPVPPPLALVPPRVVHSEPSAPAAEAVGSASPAPAGSVEPLTAALKGGKRTTGKPVGSAAGAASSSSKGHAARASMAVLPDKLELARIASTVQRERIHLAPLCACGHGQSPFDWTAYTAACAINCPLRSSAGRWAALLAFALEARGLLQPPQG